MKRLRNGKIKREDLAIQFVLQGRGREGEGRTMKVLCKELAKGRLKKKKLYIFLSKNRTENVRSEEQRCTVNPYNLILTSCSCLLLFPHEIVINLSEDYLPRLN